MEEQMIRQKIIDALGTVSAPADLVARTAVRADAIARGRAAETRLAAAPTLPPDPELLARSIVGRVMLLREPPKGIDSNKMVADLQKSEAFQRLRGETAATLLADLKTGRLIHRLGEKKPEGPAPAAAPAVPQKLAPGLVK